MASSSHRRCQYQGEGCMGTAHAGHDQCAHCYFRYIKPAIQAERADVKRRKELKRLHLSPENRALISEVDLKEPQMVDRPDPSPKPSKAIRDAILEVELDRLIDGKTEVEAFEAVTNDLVKITLAETPPPLPSDLGPVKKEPPVQIQYTRHSHKGSIDGSDMLTVDQVAEIADAYTAGMVVLEICDAYNIVTTTLYAILRERGIPLRGRPKPQRGYVATNLATLERTYAPMPQSTTPVSDAQVEPAPTNGVVSGLTEWTVTYRVVKTETRVVAAKSFNDAAAAVERDGVLVVSVSKVVAEIVG